jgi:hypothetical protein
VRLRVFSLRVKCRLVRRSKADFDSFCSSARNHTTLKATIKPKRIDAVCKVVIDKRVLIDSALFADWIPIWPSLQIGVIVPIKIIGQTRVLMPFLARKPIDVCVRKQPRFGESVPKSVVKVLRNNALIGIDQHRNVSVGVAMVVAVRPGRRVRAGLRVSREKSTDAAGAIQASAQVFASRVRDRRQIIGVTLLNYQIAVVNVINLIGLRPSTALPSEFLPNPPTHFPVIRKLRHPCVRD